MARSSVLRGLAWRQPWQAARPLARAARAAAVQQQGLTIEDGGAAAAAAAAQQQAAPTVAAPQPAAGPPGAAPAETPGPFPGDLDREKFQLVGAGPAGVWKSIACASVTAAGWASRRGFSSAGPLPARLPTTRLVGPPTKLSPNPAPPASVSQHWSVDTWRDLRPRAWFDDLTSGQQPVPARMAAFLDTLRGALGTSGALGSTEAAAYYTYHLGRSGFFVAQVRRGANMLVCECIYSSANVCIFLSLDPCLPPHVFALHSGGACLCMLLPAGSSLLWRGSARRCGPLAAASVAHPAAYPVG